MYCANCGKPITGNFCANCGAPANAAKPQLSTLHWQEERTIPELLANPEVATLIKHYAAKATLHFDANDILKIADSIMKPGGVSMKLIADISVPIFEKMGINTGKASIQTLPFGLHETIVRCMCCIAKEGLPVTKIELAKNGLIVMVTMPSDLWSWAGEMVVSMEALGEETQMNINTKIKGQLFDWGKSKRRIELLLSDIQSIPLQVS